MWKPGAPVSFQHGPDGLGTAKSSHVQTERACLSVGFHIPTEPCLDSWIVYKLFLELFRQTELAKTHAYVPTECAQWNIALIWFKHNPYSMWV